MTATRFTVDRLMGNVLLSFFSRTIDSSADCCDRAMWLMLSAGSVWSFPEMLPPE